MEGYSGNDMQKAWNKRVKGWWNTIGKDHSNVHTTITKFKKYNIQFHIKKLLYHTVSQRPFQSQ